LNLYVRTITLHQNFGSYRIHNNLNFHLFNVMAFREFSNCVMNKSSDSFPDVLDDVESISCLLLTDKFPSLLEEWELPVACKIF